MMLSAGPVFSNEASPSGNVYNIHFFELFSRITVFARWTSCDQKPNSLTYNFIEVSGLASSLT